MSIVTTSPGGTLVVCEDGTQGTFLRGLTKIARVFYIAQNLPGLSFAIFGNGAGIGI